MKMPCHTSSVVLKQPLMWGAALIEGCVLMLAAYGVFARDERRMRLFLWIAFVLSALSGVGALSNLGMNLKLASQLQAAAMVAGMDLIGTIVLPAACLGCAICLFYRAEEAQ